MIAKDILDFPGTMDRRLMLPLLLLGAVILPPAATDDLQFDFQPPFSSIELYAGEVVSMGLKVTGIICSPQVNDTDNSNVTVSWEPDVNNSSQGGVVVDYGNGTDVTTTGYGVISRGHDVTNTGYNVTNTGYDVNTTRYDVTTTGYDVTTTGYDVTTPENDVITPGNDVTLVNLTYTIYSTGHAPYTIQESHVLLSNVSDVNTQFEFTLTDIGYVTITITVTWICQNQTHTANCTYRGSVKKIPFVSAQTGLRYCTNVLTMICVALIGLQIGPGLLNLPSYRSILSTYLPSQIVIPMIFLIFSVLLHLTTPVKKGLLASVISPPSLIVLPLATILDADMSLVVTILLAAPLLSLGVMPLWLTVINGLEPQLGFGAHMLPVGHLILSFILPAGVIFLGALLTGRYPEKMAVCKQALVPMMSLTLFFELLTCIVGVSLVSVWQGGMLALVCLVLPAILLVCLMAGQALFQVELPKMKSIFLLTVMNSESIGFSLIENSVPLKNQAYAVAATNIRSMMTMVVLCGVYFGRWGCAYVSNGPHVLLPERSQEEWEEEVAREVKISGNHPEASVHYTSIPGGSYQI